MNDGLAEIRYIADWNQKMAEEEATKDRFPRDHEIFLEVASRLRAAADLLEDEINRLVADNSA